MVTPDFIQQAIRKSLKQENLHPDIEQKLLHLQRFQERQKKDGDEEPYVAVTHQHGVASGGRKRTLSDASWNEAEGLAYDGHPAVTSVATPASRSAPRKVARVAVETPRASLAAAAAATPPTRSAPSAASAAASAASNEEREAKARERSMKAQQRARERRHQQQAARLQGLMARNAEQLKKVPAPFHSPSQPQTQRTGTENKREATRKLNRNRIHQWKGSYVTWDRSMEEISSKDFSSHTNFDSTPFCFHFPSKYSVIRLYHPRIYPPAAYIGHFRPEPNFYIIKPPDISSSPPVISATLRGARGNIGALRAAQIVLIAGVAA